MAQKIEHISIEKLVLWTENPRDLLDLAPSMTDQEIATRAISKDGRSKWSLSKLLENMGERYDFSELPTVVYKGKKPIVYDGNRRMLIGKIIHRLVEVEDIDVDLSKLDFPKIVPCNVCTEKIALDNIYRKHATTGSWGPLERDIFRYEQMNKDKSTFLIIEEATGIISGNKKLNKRFVKDEVLKLDNLKKLGFSIVGGKLQSQYEKDEDAIAVLDAVVGHIDRKEITTRKSRGDIFRLLDKKLLSKQGKGKPKSFNIEWKPTPVTKGEQYRLFGNKGLVLKKGMVNNLYSDLCQLHKMKNERDWSEHYPAITHLGLRFIAEQAAADKFPRIKSRLRLKKYIQAYYRDAKRNLNEKEIRMLHTQKVTDSKGAEYAGSTLTNLLNGVAHAYTSQNNDDQAVAISLVLGQMLKISHGEE